MLVRDRGERIILAVTVIAAAIMGSIVLGRDGLPLSLRLLLTVVGAAAMSFAARAYLTHRHRRRKTR